MAFLIPDNLKSRTGVPEAIKRVARAFETGLDESAIVWYEPLYDPSGEKPHLVVLVPDRGIVVLEALEVKSSGLLGALRGKIRIVRDDREVELDNPLERAEKLAKILRERIAAEPRLSDVTIPVGAGAVLTSLSREDAQNKGVDRILDLDCCLFRHDLDATIAGKGQTNLLRTLTTMMSSTVEDPIPAEKEKLLRGIIQPETVIDRLAEGTSGDQLTIFRPGTGDDDVIRVMDRQQEAMAKSLGEGHRVIRGVAGSGKTLILLYRARLLGKLYPHFNFLLTCYTRSLAGQLRALLVGYSNVEVIHLDKLMFDTIRAGGLKHPGYKDNNSGDRVAQVALQALQRGAGSRYHAILLDEAQDFSTDALKFALGLLEPGRDDVVIVADAAQNIFRRKFSWKQAGIQAQGRSRILRVNYRNTREILEFASTFLLASRILRPDEVPDPEDENTVIPPESSMRSGPQPTVEVVRDVRGEVQASVKIVREWLRRSPAPRSIGVLYPGSIDSGIDRGNGIWDSLKNSGCEAFWLSDPRDSKSKDRLADVKSPIIVSTVHSAKGLEFPYVVLCGLWRDNVDGEDNRRVAYVGMTRATEFLAVVSREGNPLIDDLKMAASRTTGSPA
jgi:hypothetical protein